MHIEPHQIFNMDNPSLEEIDNKIVSEEFNKIFSDTKNTRIFLRSSFEGLAPYKFVESEGEYYCLKEIISNNPNPTLSISVNGSKNIYTIIFVNKNKIESSTLFDKYVEGMRIYRSRTSN